MPSLKTLELFCRIADAGSLSQVARTLELHPSQLSRELAALEAELGSTLIVRSTRKLSLSPAGQRYLAHARELLRQHQAALDDLAELQGSAEGLLRIAAAEFVGAQLLAPWLAEFQERHPRLRFELWLSDEPQDLLSQPVDLALRSGFPSLSGGWYRHYGHYPRQLYASPAYLARHGQAQHPDELAAHRLILHSAVPSEDWHFQGQGERLTRRIQPWNRCNTGSGLLGLVQAGLGIGRLAPWLVAEALAQGQLQGVLGDWELTTAQGERASFYAVYPEREPPYKTRLLLDFLGEKLRAPPYVYAPAARLRPARP